MQYSTAGPMTDPAATMGGASRRLREPAGMPRTDPNDPCESVALAHLTIDRLQNLLAAESTEVRRNTTAGPPNAGTRSLSWRQTNLGRV